MAQRPSARGFTLVELLTASAIFAIALAAATGVFIAQNTAYLRETGVRESQTQARTAIEVLSRAARMAGYGIDPQLAFDFDFYDCSLPGVPGTGSQRARCAALGRDSATAADEIVVSSRNPYYSTSATSGGCSGMPTLVGNAWQVIATAGGGTPSVTLRMRGGDTIRRGQVIQVLCQDAATYTYVRATAEASAPSGACANIQVSVSTPVTVSGPAGNLVSPYTRSDLLTAACFSAGSGRAFLVDRQRFYVHQVTTGDQPRPYLMLDRGIDTAGPNGSGPDGQLDDNDLIPIASDIEDIQISYFLEQIGLLQTTSAMVGAASTHVLDSNANGIWGDAAGVAEQITYNTSAGAPYNLAASYTAANTAAAGGTLGVPCFNVNLAPYRHPCILDKGTLEVAGAAAHPYRWMAWPANITHVRLAVSARASTPAAGTTGMTQGDTLTLPALANRSAVNLSTTTGFYRAMNPTRYQRTTLQGAVRTVNLASSGMFTF